MLVSAPDKSAWYGRDAQDRASGYEVRRTDWDDALTRVRNSTRHEWDAGTVYVVRLHCLYPLTLDLTGTGRRKASRRRTDPFLPSPASSPLLRAIPGLRRAYKPSPSPRTTSTARETRQNARASHLLRSQTRMTRSASQRNGRGSPAELSLPRTLQRAPSHKKRSNLGSGQCRRRGGKNSKKNTSRTASGSSTT